MSTNRAADNSMASAAENLSVDFSGLERAIDKNLALIDRLITEKRLLEYALSELKTEYENVMSSEFGTYSKPRPWATVEAWQRAEALLHADDVPEGK